MERVFEIEAYDEWESIIENSPRLVIFYGSRYCGHCTTITPFFEKLATQYQDVIFSHLETSRHKVADLDGVPTFAAYQNGQEFDLVVGGDTKALTNLVRSL